MKAAYCNINDDSNNCAKLLGTATKAHHGGLISENPSLLSNNDGMMDSCSFFSEPSDETIMAFGESFGEFDFTGSGETSGTIAFTGSGESSGSIASAGGMSSSSSSGCACCYSC